MAYQGNSPAAAYTSFAQQTFSIVNSQTSYTLDHPVANGKEILLYINNVKQVEGSGEAYTASGNTLTIASALTSGSDEMYCLFIGKAIQNVVPPSGSVTNAMLSSGSFSNITGVGTLSNGLTLSDNILFDTASKGIYLGVTSATSSNLLDDYEEGTFTPEFADSLTGGNLASGTFSGFYTKIGRIVHIEMNFPNINTTGMTSSNTIRIRNLPFQFTSSTNYASSGTVNSDRLNFTNYVITNGGASSTSVVLKDIRDNTTDTNLTVAAITVSGGTDVNVSHTYITDA